MVQTLDAFSSHLFVVLLAIYHYGTFGICLNTSFTDPGSPEFPNSGAASISICNAEKKACAIGGEHLIFLALDICSYAITVSYVQGFWLPLLPYAHPIQQTESPASWLWHSWDLREWSNAGTHAACLLMCRPFGTGFDLKELRFSAPFLFFSTFFPFFSPFLRCYYGIFLYLSVQIQFFFHLKNYENN